MTNYRSYVVTYDNNLSYIPDGSAWLEGMPYRKWNYYYFSPGTEKEVDAILAAWKSLYEQKEIPNGYRIYRGKLGIAQPVVIFTTWAKNPAEHHQQMEQIGQILGDEASALLLGMLDLAVSIETLEGYFVPEFSYQPAD